MIEATATQTRQTKYCKSIRVTLSELGHATNSELLHRLRNTYPELSATTVHRATTRLAARDEISIAPATKDGSMRYDSNLSPHDHFLCRSCDQLKDVRVMDKLNTILDKAICDCQISGRLTISGLCKDCIS